jgi:DNA-binding response OmpR family regulator
MEKGAKVLVVDDDPDIVEAVTTVLEAHGHEVISAANGALGLEMLRKEKPDLIILDLLMPKMDGFAVLKEFRHRRWAKYRKIPIIVLSSIKKDVSDRRYELETGSSLQVNAYIEKPVNPHSLMAHVENLLEKKE